MGTTSAGLLMFRRAAAGAGAGPEVLLVHPGGPFWARKDAGAWTIPKGEPAQGEPLLETAKREFREETGFEAEGPFLLLGSIKQKGGKRVHAWAFEGGCDPSELTSDTFELEWPPRSGQYQQFPEVDRAAWFDPATARRKIHPAQAVWLDELNARLAGQ